MMIYGVKTHSIKQSLNINIYNDWTGLIYATGKI